MGRREYAHTGVNGSWSRCPNCTRMKHSPSSHFYCGCGCEWVVYKYNKNTEE